MKSHKRKSSGGSVEFMCDRGNCGKTFERQTALQKHLNIHDNNIVKCYFCPWISAVGQNVEISTHLNQHFNRAIFICDVCGTKFFRNAMLKNHFERHHEKIQGKYKCKLCDYKTFCRDNLNQHTSNNHK